MSRQWRKLFRFSFPIQEGSTSFPEGEKGVWFICYLRVFLVYTFLSSYLSELRNIAVNHRLLASGTTTRMKRASILLGSRRVKKAHVDPKKPIDDALDEEEWDTEHDLLRPDQVVIADDTSMFQVFGDLVFCSPQEDLLEGMFTAWASREATLISSDRVLRFTRVSATDFPRQGRVQNCGRNQRHEAIERHPDIDTRKTSALFARTHACATQGPIQLA